MKIKVRFHLGAGPNYMQWQVKNGDAIEYYDPKDVTLMMSGCKLRNHRNIAEKIHSGENKSVCAWIECRQIDVYPHNLGEHYSKIDVFTKIKYNPRVNPFWVDKDGNNIDDSEHVAVFNFGKELFVFENLEN